LLAALWQHAKGYYVDADGVPTSERSTYYTLIQRLKKHYGRTLVEKLGPLRLRAFRQTLIEEGLSRRISIGASAASARTSVGSSRTS
jgi:hypothetical protein